MGGRKEGVETRASSKMREWIRQYPPSILQMAYEVNQTDTYETDSLFGIRDPPLSLSAWLGLETENPSNNRRTRNTLLTETAISYVPIWHIPMHIPIVSIKSSFLELFSCILCIQQSRVFWPLFSTPNSSDLHGLRDEALLWSSHTAAIKHFSSFTHTSWKKMQI